ncbi:hypothetical protein [Chryseolinea serpens]|uniref:hypothetical protein n=1 Tax=Chryseolinea serpens TaxID=947013 RepID=UPI0009335153|nr:hypothetical protein [Chryseolinea serpens]
MSRIVTLVLILQVASGATLAHGYGMGERHSDTEIHAGFHAKKRHHKRSVKRVRHKFKEEGYVYDDVSARVLKRLNLLLVIYGIF